MGHNIIIQDGPPIHNRLKKHSPDSHIQAPRNLMSGRQVQRSWFASQPKRLAARVVLFVCQAWSQVKARGRYTSARGYRYSLGIWLCCWRIVVGWWFYLKLLLLLQIFCLLSWKWFHKWRRFHSDTSYEMGVKVGSTRSLKGSGWVGLGLKDDELATSGTMWYSYHAWKNGSRSHPAPIYNRDQYHWIWYD